MSSSLYLWVFLIEFSVSAAALISKVACLPVPKTQQHLGEFSVGTVGGDRILKILLVSYFSPLGFFFSLNFKMWQILKNICKDDFFPP